MSLGLLLDVEMPLIIRLGGAAMLLRDVAGLSGGSVVELRRAPEDPVEVVVNGHVVARGLIAEVHGNYGVRITEVLSSNESESA